MRTIKFPDMLNSNSTNVWKSSEYHEATMQSTKLLLQTERGELFGDPYFGLLFKRYLFDQNSYILQDQLIDMIYTQLAIFIPQVRVSRSDITILRDEEKGKLYCRFHGINQIDYQPDTYTLCMYSDTDFENR